MAKNESVTPRPVAEGGLPEFESQAVRVAATPKGIFAAYYASKRENAYLIVMILSIALTLSLIFQQPIDGTTLTFRLEKDSITVQVGRWKLRSSDTTELSRFIDTHLKEIDPHKVLVYGPGSAQYKSFAPIIIVLKKHDWMNFKLIDTDAKPKTDSPKIESRRT